MFCFLVCSLCLFLFPVESILCLVALIIIVSIGGFKIWLETRGKIENKYLFVSVAIFSLLVSLSAPTLYFRDGGEIGASIHCLGVSHPTGFPILMILGKLFDLLPFGSVFFRLNILSCFFTALSCYLLLKLIEQLSSCKANLVAIMVGQFSFISSHVVWLHATTIEVYALAVTGLGVSILTFVFAYQRQDLRLLLLGWFFSGLGLGGHITWWLYAFIFGLLITISIAYKTKQMCSIILSGIGFSIGILLVLYLFVSASKDPVMNWGDPSTLNRLIDHLSGKLIRMSFHKQMGIQSITKVAINAKLMTDILLDGCLIFLPFALLGIFSLVRSNLLITLGFLAILFLDFVYSIIINPMGMRELQTGVPSFFFMSLLSAIGVLRCYDFLHSLPKFSLHLVIFILAIIQFSISPSKRFMNEVYSPQELTSYVLNSVRPTATILTSSDDLSAMIAGLKVVEGTRPDVLSLVRQHIGDTRYVKRMIRFSFLPSDEKMMKEVEEKPFEVSGETPAKALSRLISYAKERGDVLIEMGEYATDSEVLHLFSPGFPLWTNNASIKPFSVEDTTRFLDGCDSSGVSFIAGNLRVTATLLAQLGMLDEAIKILYHAFNIFPTDSRILLNLGVLLFNQGEKERGLSLLRQSVISDPAYAHGFRTLAKYERIAGNIEKADEAEQIARSLE